jgi:hypothetical protein
MLKRLTVSAAISNKNWLPAAAWSGFFSAD